MYRFTWDYDYGLSPEQRRQGIEDGAYPPKLKSVLLEIAVIVGVAMAMSAIAEVAFGWQVIS